MKTSPRASRVRHLVIAAVLCLFATGAQNENSKSRHAAIIARILSYELTLEERIGESLAIAIVHRADDPVSTASADEWARAFRDLAFVNVKGRPLVVDVVESAPSDLHAAIDKGADVLLVTAGLDAETSTVARIARSRRILTVGNSPDYVQADLAVCVIEENEKTKILINLKAADLERIRFSSRLLNLATVIR